MEPRMMLVLVAVFVEQAEGVGIGKVFKLDETIYSKPVGRERKEHMIASARQIPGSGEEAQAGQQVGEYGMAHSPGCLPPGRLLDSWALPTSLWMKMGKGEKGLWAWWSVEPTSLSLRWAGGSCGPPRGRAEIGPALLWPVAI